MKKLSIDKIKIKYPICKKVFLIYMKNEPQMHFGLTGTITLIDDIGQIHVNWNNGSRLAISNNDDIFILY